MSLKRALADEEALEKELFAEVSDPEKSTTPIPNVDTFELDDDSDEKNPNLDADEVVEDSKEDANKKKQSWKQRFASYKGSTDRTISNLRKENQSLIGQISEARKEISRQHAIVAELQNRDKDVFGEVITPEDVETIGVEAVDIVKKTTKRATEAAVGPLLEEIKQMKAKELEAAKKAHESKRVAEYGKFTSRLGELVPDYQAVNLDPGFEIFMMNTDPNTGEKRIDAFRRAEDYLDHERVADFFNDYKASIPRSKKEMLEDKITVEGSASGSAPAQSKKETFSIKDVDKFFNDITKGVYKGRMKEADEIEARITRAYIEGRITD